MAGSDETPAGAASRDLTRLLQGFEAGDSRGKDELLPLVYDELRALARQRMANEAPGQTLQATSLVHEAWLRLVGGASGQAGAWTSRAHFFGAAAQAMRRILVEQARRKARIKHGDGRPREDVELAEPEIEPPGDDVLAVDEALRRLEARDPRKGAIVDLRYFSGFSNEETARALGLSVGTIEREWRFIRAWLRTELGEREP